MVLHLVITLSNTSSETSTETFWFESPYGRLYPWPGASGEHWIKKL